jgi:DNA-binding IclR family transcriptional regulator
MASEGRAMGILQRSSSLIQLLADRGPLSAAEVAEEIGMPRPSVYRLADALTQTRLVEAASDGKLRLSLRWLKLSDAARSGMQEWSHARPLLDELASQTGLTIYLSVPRADRAICIDWSPGRALSVLALKPGRSLPLYAGSRTCHPRLPAGAARGLPPCRPVSRADRPHSLHRSRATRRRRSNQESRIQRLR